MKASQTILLKIWYEKFYFKNLLLTSQHKYLTACIHFKIRINMVSDYKEILSDSAKGMKRSAIRELLKLTQKP